MVLKVLSEGSSWEDRRPKVFDDFRGLKVVATGME
jgi:hypothetical protein